MNEIVGITVTFDVLDRLPVPASPAGRAVEPDDGKELWLAPHGEGDIAAAVSLLPIRAIAIAVEPLATPLSRLR